jgi:trans-aconitate 2-methyltransferase
VSETERREWDAETYDRVSDIQAKWSLAVLDRLDLRGDETVLDAGCGSGRVTKLLLERLPRGHVIGVDSSTSMIEQAREALPE